MKPQFDNFAILGELNGIYVDLPVNILIQIINIIYIPSWEFAKSTTLVTLALCYRDIHCKQIQIKYSGFTTIKLQACLFIRLYQQMSYLQWVEEDCDYQQRHLSMTIAHGLKPES